METLAIETIALLTPYLAKGPGEITKSVAKDVWEKVKSVFISKEKVIVLEKLEMYPNDVKFHEHARYILQRELEKNSEFATNLAKLVTDLKALTA